MIITQISVFLENRAGQLAEITGVLAKNGIDLRAINIAETRDYGVVRLITETPEKTISVLKDSGFLLSSNPVVAVSVPDEPGGLAQVVEKMTRANMDVEYMYSIFGYDEGRAHMLFKVADPEALEKLVCGGQSAR